MRVKSQEKCRFGTCKQLKLAFPDHQSKACRRNLQSETCPSACRKYEMLLPSFVPVHWEFVVNAGELGGREARRL